jgi:uncharacterized membrane protein|tara:strand:- start:311 stop:592 length:282 start_codon:yes stop_codon:yes gene_type:complete
MEILETPAARAVLGITVLAILTTIAYFVVTNYRDRIDQDIPSPEEHLDNFQEIHSQGDISDKEFRTIETVLEQLEHQQSQPNDQPPTEDKSEG